jgi:hypothetical protein
MNSILFDHILSIGFRLLLVILNSFFNFSSQHFYWSLKSFSIIFILLFIISFFINFILYLRLLNWFLLNFSKLCIFIIGIIKSTRFLINIWTLLFFILSIWSIFYILNLSECLNLKISKCSLGLINLSF